MFLFPSRFEKSFKKDVEEGKQSKENSNTYLLEKYGVINHPYLRSIYEYFWNLYIGTLLKVEYVDMKDIYLLRKALHGLNMPLILNSDNKDNVKYFEIRYIKEDDMFILEETESSEITKSKAYMNMNYFVEDIVNISNYISFLKNKNNLKLNNNIITFDDFYKNVINNCINDFNTLPSNIKNKMLSKPFDLKKDEKEDNLYKKLEDLKNSKLKSLSKMTGLSENILNDLEKHILNELTKNPPLDEKDAMKKIKKLTSDFLTERGIDPSVIGIRVKKIENEEDLKNAIEDMNSNFNNDNNLDKENDIDENIEDLDISDLENLLDSMIKKKSNDDDN